MRWIAFLAFPVVFSSTSSAQWTFTGNTTPTWQEVISRYSKLDGLYAGVQLFEIGHDDDGSPIHLFVLADGSGFTPDSIRASGKNILWITNGVHPGESDGIDAGLMLAQALLDSDQLMGLLVNTAVCIVPVYNVSGAKNRSSTSRANQNGPEEYGFRGNARNLDLNRDFIKTDSENAKSLIAAMAYWDPDVYLETHVSNGADHQYVMELLMTHSDKQDPALRAFTNDVMVPRLYEWMETRKIPMCPYFETLGQTPEDGLSAFVDGPRYSTGHSTLRQRIGILSETHMLKPYADRVNATLQLQFAILAAMNEHPEELATARVTAFNNAAIATAFSFNWVLDTVQKETLDWKGYEAVRVKSRVSGSPCIAYDRSRPSQQPVPWYEHAFPTLELIKPTAYLIPRAWHEVIARLELDGVELQEISERQHLIVEVQYIQEFNTTKDPYEGHYLHSKIGTRTVSDTVIAQPGDVLVPMGFATDRLVMEILEPRANDSFFAWGFFDSILQQKEWFSDYVFEDIAASLLAEDPELRSELEAKKRDDHKFATDPWAQLYFVYQRSPYFEPTYRRYPVLRVVDQL